MSIIRENKINYQINNDNQVYKFNLDSMSETGLEENLEFNYYTFSENPINNYLYASISNFVSSEFEMKFCYVCVKKVEVSLTFHVAR